MGITNTQVRFGWCDASGRSLEWSYWQRNPKREAVMYEFDCETKRLTKIRVIYSRQAFKHGEF